MALPVLWHFTFSYFAEKARWALDFKGIPHVRRALLPGLHLPRVWWMTGGRTVPVLVLDGEAISDSTRIIAALERYRPEPALYPPGESDRRRALELEEFFDEELGHLVRIVILALEHGDLEYAATVFSTGYGTTTRRVLRAGLPLIRGVVERRFDAMARHAAPEAAFAKVDAALDRIERELEPSGYLVGERFSVADLTAAALLAPVVLPPGYPFPPAPPATARYRETLSARPAFRWATEVYGRHRGRSAAVARP
jgi:glutathione S-transferase